MMIKIQSIHHIGKVVSDIKSEFTKYRDLGFEVDENIYIDTEQKVRVGKIKLNGKMVIELLEPLDETSPIARFAKERGGFHHISIEVESILSYLEYMEKNNLGFRASKITTSVFNERKVCFIVMHDKEIIELIERS